ncbi:MAG: metallophosphoesterase [Bacteroidales bacterium]|nr:metallophosphoesterase [Bacteroidales bacterium]
MKKFFLILFVLILGSGNMLSIAQKDFKSPVDTEKKPWTNLSFYNDPENFQFAIITDLWGGNRPGIFEDAIKKINIMYPEFVLSVGDIISGKTMDTVQIGQEWNEVNHLISDLKMPFFYLPGNHDISNQVMAKEWEKRFGKRYYSFIYKNTLFLILDSNDDDDYNLTQKQTDFVKEILNKNPNVKWTFLLMHHPIWTYNTKGRFEEIEVALKGRKYSVLAGHTHHYLHEERKGQNYYILGTTGGGSRLRGNYFGELDHIVWVTMTDAGPSMANLRLDGILPHDIVTKETKALADVLANNAVFEHVVLCNPGEKFTDGTLYLNFKNTGAEQIYINLQFFHQHQLVIPESQIQINLEAGKNRVVKFPVSSALPLSYNTIENIQISWSMGYDLPEYSDFELNGVYNLEIKPTATSLLKPQIPKFLNELKVSAKNPYQDLKLTFDFNGEEIPKDKIMNGSEIQIDQAGTVGIKLQNDAGQSTIYESWSYEKVTKLYKPKKLRNPKEGLEYTCFEGAWDKMPDFKKLKAKSNGIVKDFWVLDYALRQDNFGMVFTGYIQVPDDEMYIFSSRTDDACQLFINGELIVSQGKGDEAKESGAIALKKGFHPVSIQYMQGTGYARLRIYYKKTYENNWKELNVRGSFFY